MENLKLQAKNFDSKLILMTEIDFLYNNPLLIFKLTK